ncbi:hypothetical protein ECP03023085_3657 [Escherichia coli P0302308.5]|nr:hypothetical protein ECP03023085_3657 [Escherichia coli P0302308.5]
MEQGGRQFFLMIFWLFLLDTTHPHFYGLIQAVQCKSWQLSFVYLHEYTNRK